ncbi:MAG TPA: M28 family peptidase [Gaiellaceae bacterium]|nr:M28 family peptidase [Gaiellaceae bacterium]
MSTTVEERISAGYLQEVVERLAGFRSHPLGFRVAGTPEERKAAAWIAREMRGLGLADVVEEPVPVDAWRFRGAWVEAEGKRYECASMGGVPETPPRGVAGELRFVRRGGRRELDAAGDLAGRVVLVDWCDEGLWPYDFALELGLRGAAAVVVTCFPGGPYYQEPGALGTFDAMYHADAPPLVTIRKEDAAELAERAGARARVVLRAPMPRAEGANVVGYLGGGRRGGPLVVAGHHDGWMGGAAYDDLTGVAATLGLARAFVEAGERPRHTIAFVSHTAEEYGITDSRYDWCYGAWWQVVEEHREWAARVPFYLNVEGSGFPGVFEPDAPPELAAWARRVCRRAERDGLLPFGWRLGKPTTWTEVWTFLAAGIPGLNVSTFTKDYARTLYHTQYDTSDRVDFDYLEKLTRVMARFLLEADADPDRILDFAARARDLRRAGFDRALDHVERGRGRRDFTALARGLHGLDAKDEPAYPHEQTARDVERLEEGLEAVRAGRHARAARRLAGVGINALCVDLSEEAFAREHARRGRNAPRVCWGAQGDPATGPNLWRELASLRGEPGSRARGPWIERSLERHLARTRRELERRLDRMEAAVRGKLFPLPRARL